MWITSKDKLISGGNDSTLILYSIVNNKKEAEVLNAHTLNIKQIILANNEEFMITAGGKEGLNIYLNNNTFYFFIHDFVMFK